MRGEPCARGSGGGRRTGSATPILLLFLALAGPVGACAGDASTVRARLDRCKRTATTAGVQFSCDGFRAIVADHPEGDPSEVFELYVAGFRAGPEGFTSSPITLRLNRARWTGVTFSTPGPFLSGPVEGRLIAGPVAGGSRVVSCMTVSRFSRQRCEGVVELLAETGSGPWRVLPDAPTFLGRPVFIPAGCQVQVATPSRLQAACESGELLTNTFDTDGAAEGLVAVMYEQLKAKLPLAVDAGARACWIGGAEARCRSLRFGASPQLGLGVLGSAAVDGRHVVAFCGQPAQLPAVHPLCEPVIRF